MKEFTYSEPKYLNDFPTTVLEVFSTTSGLLPCPNRSFLNDLFKEPAN